MAKKKGIEGLVLSNSGQDFSVDKYSMKGFENSQYDFGRRSATEFNDLEDYRAAQQPFLSKLANGVSRAIGNTALRVGEGLLFIPAAAYGLATDADQSGDLSLADVYKNPVSETARKIDEEFLQKFLPVYESNKEKDGFWGAVGGAKLWTDKLPDGISFMASMLLTIEAGGTGAKSISKAVPKISKLLGGLEAGEDATSLVKSLFSNEAVSALNSMASSTGKITNGIKTLAKSAYGATVEAAMEAQGTYDSVFKELEQRRKQELGVEQLDEKELGRIRQIASNAGDANFGVNIALLTASNAIQFGKLFSGKYSNDLIKASNIVEKEGGEFARKQLSGMSKYYDKFKILANPLTESLEEGSQTFSDKFFTALFTDATPESSANLDDITNASVKAREALFGSEGIQSMFLGAVIGGLGAGAGYISDRVNKRMGEDAVANSMTDQAIAFANNNQYSKSAQALYKSLAKSQDYQQGMNGAMAAGDRFTYETLKAVDFHNTVSGYAEIGKFDNLISKLEEDKNLSNEDFAAKYDIDDLNYDKNAKIDALIKQAKDIKKSRDSIYNSIGHDILTNSINRNIPIEEEMRKLNHLSLMHHLQSDLATRERQFIKEFKDENNYDYMADVIDKSLDGKSLQEKSQELKTVTDEYSKILSKFREAKKNINEATDIKVAQAELQELQDSLNEISEKSIAIYNNIANTPTDLNYLSMIDKQTQSVIENIKENDVRKPKEITNRAIFDKKMKDFKRIQRLKNEVLLFQDDYLKDGELSKTILQQAKNENAKREVVKKFTLDTAEERITRIEQKFGRTLDEAETNQIQATVGNKYNALRNKDTADGDRGLEKIEETPDVVTENDLFVMDIPGWKYEKVGDSWKKVDLAHNLNMGSANAKRTKNIYNPAANKTGYKRVFVKIDKTELIDGIPYVHVRNTENNRVTKMTMSEFQSYNPARKQAISAEEVFFQQNAGRLIDYMYAEPNFKSKAGYEEAIKNKAEGEYIEPFKTPIKVTGFLRYNSLGQLVLEYKDKNGHIKHTKGGVAKAFGGFEYTKPFVVGGMEYGSGVVKIYSQAESDAFIYDNTIQFGIDLLNKELEDRKNKPQYPYNDAIIGKLQEQVEQLTISINRNNELGQDTESQKKVLENTLKLIEALQDADKKAEAVNKGRELAIERIEKELEALEANRDVAGSEFLEMYNEVEASKEETRKDIGEVYEQLNKERDELKSQIAEIDSINKDLRTEIVAMARKLMPRELESYNSDNEVLAYLKANADSLSSELLGKVAEFLTNRNKVGELYDVIHTKVKEAAVEAQNIRSDVTELSTEELAFIKLQRDLFTKLKRKMTSSMYRTYPKVKTFSRNYQESGEDLVEDSKPAQNMFISSRPSFNEVAFGKTVTSTLNFVDGYNNPLNSNSNNQNAQLAFNRVITKMDTNDYYLKLVTANDNIANFDYSPEFNGEPVYFLAVVNKTTNNVVTQQINGKHFPAVVTMSKPNFNDSFGFRYREFYNKDENGNEYEKTPDEINEVLQQFDSRRAEYVEDLKKLEAHKQNNESVGYDIVAQGFGIPISTEKANPFKTVISQDEFNQLIDDTSSESPASFIYVPTSDGDYSIGNTSYPVMNGVAYYVNTKTNKIIPLNTKSLQDTLESNTLYDSIGNALFYIQKGIKQGKGIEHLNTVRDNVSKYVRFNKDGEFAFNYRISPDGKYAELVMGDTVIDANNVIDSMSAIKDFLAKKRFNYAMQRQDTNVSLKQPISIYTFTRDGGMSKYGSYKNYNDFVMQHDVFTSFTPPATSMQFHNSYAIFSSNNIKQVEPIKGAEEFGKSPVKKEAEIKTEVGQGAGRGQLTSSLLYESDFEEKEIDAIKKFLSSPDNINGYSYDDIIDFVSNNPHVYKNPSYAKLVDVELYNILDSVFERINGKPEEGAKSWADFNKPEPVEEVVDELPAEVQQVNVPVIKEETPNPTPSELNEKIESENVTVEPKQRRSINRKKAVNVQPPNVEDTEEQTQDVQTTNNSAIDLDMPISINRNMNVSQEELNSARERFKTKYRVNFDIVSGLIDNKAFGRVTDAGNVLISDIAPEGVTFHEEFHLVSQFMLSKAKRDALYDEWRKVNNKPDADWREVEEALAEEFRHYALTKNLVKESSLLKKIFDSLLAHIKSLIRLFKNQPLKQELFEDIVNGKFYGMSKANVSISANHFDMKATGDMTVDERKEFYKSVTFHGFNYIIDHYIKEYKIQGKEISKAQLLANLKLNSDFMHEVFNTAETTEDDGTRVKLYTHYINNAIEEALYEAGQDRYWDYVENNLDVVHEELSNYISSAFKGSIESPEFAELEDETIKDKDSLANKPANQENHTKSAVGFLKFIINTIPNKERNRLGMTVGINADAVVKELYTTLSDIVTFDDYTSRLLNSTSPNIQAFVEATGLKTDGKNKMVTQLNTAIFQYLSKMKNRYYSLFFDANNIPRIISNNAKKNIEDVKANFRNRHTMVLQSTNLGKALENGEYVLDLEVLKPLLKGATTIFKKLEVMERLGVYLTDDEIFNTEMAVSLLDERSPEYAMRSAMFARDIPYQTEINEFFNALNTAVNKFTKENRAGNFNLFRQVQSSINKLAKIEADNIKTDEEFSLKNNENKTVYSMQNHIGITKRLDYLKTNTSLDTFAKNSVWRNFINQIQVVHLFGATSESTGIGVNADDMSDEDMFIMYFTGLMQENIVPYVFSGDKSIQYGFKVPNVINVNNPVEMREILAGYAYDAAKLREEAETTFKSRGISIEKFNSRSLGILDTIITNKSFKEGFNSSQMTTSEAFKEQIYNEFEDYISAISSVYKDKLKEAGVLGQDNKFKNLDLGLYSNKDTDSIVKEFARKFFIGQMEQEKLFVGSSNFYGDPSKRIPLFNSAKLNMRLDRGFLNWFNTVRKPFNSNWKFGENFDSIILDDIKVESKNKELSKLHEAYESNEATDGQGYIHIEALRFMLDSSGLWTPTHEKAFQAEMSGTSSAYTQNVIKQAAGYFMAAKPQYYGYQNIGDVSVPTLYKLSVVPLFPSMVKGKKLEVLYNYMTDNKVSFAMYASANKVGRKLDADGKGVSLFKKDSKGRAITNDHDSFGIDTYKANSLKQTTSWRYMGIQVTMNQKPHDTNNLGTQMLKIIGSNPKQGTIDLIKKHDELLVEKAKLNVEKLYAKYDITENGIGNREALKKLLVDEAVKSNIPTNLLNAINNFTQYDIIPNRDKLEQIIMSIANNNIVKQKTAGDSKAQMSSALFDSVDTDDSLRFYEKDKDGNTRGMEVYMPAGYLNKNYKIFEKYLEPKGNGIMGFKQEYLDEDGYPKDELAKLTTILGYRIPTQSLNFLDKIIIKGFINPELGNLIVVPYELTTKSGSDFDIDKLNLIYPTVNNKGYIEGHIDNKLLETQLAILSHPDNYENLTRPNSTDNVKPYAMKIEQAMGINSNTDQKGLFYNAVDSIKRRISYLTGKNVLGQVALHITHHAQSQLHQLEFNPSYVSKIGVDFSMFPKFFKTRKSAHYSLGKILDAKDRLISDILSQFADGSVDVAKGDWISSINFNTHTASTYLTMIRLGIPYEEVIDFMSSPIIRKLVSLVIKGNSIAARIENKAVKDVNYKQYKDEFDDFDSIGYQDAKAEYRRKTNPIGVENTIQYLLDPVINSNQYWGTPEQLKILRNFQSFYKLGNQLNDLMRISTFDTKGGGKGIVDFDIMERNYDKNMKTFYEEGVFVNLSNMFAGYIGNFKQALTNYSSKVSNIFGYTALKRNPKVNDLMNNIAYYKGKSNAISIAMIKANNTLIASVLQSRIPNAKSEVERLLYNPFNGMANTIMQIQKGTLYPDLKNNELIKSLIPVLNPNPINVMNKLGQNNVFLNDASRISIDEIDLLSDAWLEIEQAHPDLSKDLLFTSIFQSGINKTNNSLTTVIPEVLIRKHFPAFAIKPQEVITEDTIAKIKLRNLKVPAIVNKNEKDEDFTRGISILNYGNGVYRTNANNDGKNTDMVSDIANISPNDEVNSVKQLALNYIAQMPVSNNTYVREAIDEIANAKDVKELSQAINKLCKL